ncbi:putative armadillo-like helical, pumilio, RNA binding domain-containing protein [Lupinus albus]|uniref:Putative armadillo-like helical, pumilio, RNA binding domain-containing protein n=1 Tax=Lupinus albus TaxID=3870 RepID=A0A6A4PVT6_LUPAL|nr:putative armadillo-like helical, pumilio, RNA binding domain-containing protein [Lupinus albus]
MHFVVEIVENMKDYCELEELEMLLNEIPNAWNGHDHDDHNNGHGHDHAHEMCVMKDGYDDDGSLTKIQYAIASSPASGFSLKSDGSSSSSLFSAGHALSDTGSPTLEDLKAAKPSVSSNSFRFGSNAMTPDLTFMNKANESLVDELDLCATLSQMHINNQQENPNDFNYGSVDMNQFPFRDCSLSRNTPVNDKKYRDYYNFKRECLDYLGVQSHFPTSPLSRNAGMSLSYSGLSRDYETANLFGSRQCAISPETIPSQLNGFGGSMDSPRQLLNNYNYYYKEIQPPEPTVSLSRNPMVDALLYAQENGMSLVEETGMPRLLNSSHCTNLRSFGTENLVQHCRPMCNKRAMPPSKARTPQGNLDAIMREGSYVIQGEGLNYVVGKGSDRSRFRSKAPTRETGFVKHPKRSELDMGNRLVGIYEHTWSSRNELPKYNSLAEVRGNIHLIAKDQYGCRFLQRVFDEGTPEDVQEIFNEIINHVVELMMNPFGNYLMQKLLDVCTEEQRTRMLLIITEEPGQLVRISLNTHGTRVVQKLIETLRTRQQISLAVSALEPGFLSLIKDLNGNHVVQHCLLCLSNEDKRFIFVAAAKYCVEIATHKHGCCVLQKCIGYSTGEHLEKLIAEISANALLLAQDQYGIPSATASLRFHLEGNYVHLSRHKFGSHVVEKCLVVFNDENRSRLIHELLSSPCFEHLLLDPHANYVVQKALLHSEGCMRRLLVNVIESHEAICRNSPYSKKIIAHLKK